MLEPDHASLLNGSVLYSCDQVFAAAAVEKCLASSLRETICSGLDPTLKMQSVQSESIAEFILHYPSYMLSPGERLLRSSNFWSPILRPSARPTVTAIKSSRGICF